MQIFTPERLSSNQLRLTCKFCFNCVCIGNDYLSATCRYSLEGDFQVTTFKRATCKYSLEGNESSVKSPGHLIKTTYDFVHLDTKFDANPSSCTELITQYTHMYYLCIKFHMTLDINKLKINVSSFSLKVKYCPCRMHFEWLSKCFADY